LRSFPELAQESAASRIGTARRFLSSGNSNGVPGAVWTGLEPLEDAVDVFGGQLDLQS
jgi:hypothetical protein